MRVWNRPLFRQCFVISNVLRTAKPLQKCIYQTKEGPSFGHFCLILALICPPPPPRGVERGTPEVPNGRSGKFRKISRPLDATVHLVSLIQDGKSVPWIHSKCGRHVAWSWRWGVTSGASQNTPPGPPISEEFRKNFGKDFRRIALRLRLRLRLRCGALRHVELRWVALR